MTTLKTAAQYQHETEYRRNDMAGGGLDWDNKPDPYKKYPDAEVVELPRDLTLPRAPGHGILSGLWNRDPQSLTKGSLANLLYMAYGFTAQVDYGAELFLYRSAPSAGALYPAEIYIAAKDVEGLEDGLYHYCVIDFSLHKLRSGPPPEGITAPALYISGLFFRSAWKYRKRAFRYSLLDAGHLAENLVLSASALGLETEFSTEFSDDIVNGYLGFSPEKESGLAVIRFSESGEGTGDAADLGPVPDPAPVAPKEFVFDEISQATMLTKKPMTDVDPPVSAWPEARKIDLPEPEWKGLDGPSFVQVLQSRRSARNFKPKNPTIQEFVKGLAQVATPDVGKLVTMGMVVNEVQDLKDGYYRLTGPEGPLVLQERGFIAPSMARAALDQDWSGRANIILVISAPLAGLEETLGPRALRAAYLAAGRIGQRAYLAAQVLGWGCCGIGAFFDEEVRAVISLPDGEDPLYILPFGPIKKRTHGGRPTPK